MLTKLNDETVSELLKGSTLERIENLLSIEEQIERMDRVRGWFRRHNVDANASIEELEEKLSGLLGISPNLRRKFKEKASVWGFEFDASKFAPNNQLVLSVEENGVGMKISVHKKFRKNMLVDLIQEIEDKLN